MRVKVGDVVEFKSDVEQIGVVKKIVGNITSIEVTDPKTGKKRIHKDFIDYLTVI
jgi:uncharacterized protein YkvS